MRHLIAILAAVIVSNAVTLSVYLAGYPVAALAISAPVGLLAGITMSLALKQVQRGV